MCICCRHKVSVWGRGLRNGQARLLSRTLGSRSRLPSTGLLLAQCTRSPNGRLSREPVPAGALPASWDLALFPSPLPRVAPGCAVARERRQEGRDRPWPASRLSIASERSEEPRPLSSLRTASLCGGGGGGVSNAHWLPKLTCIPDVREGGEPLKWSPMSCPPHPLKPPPRDLDPTCGSFSARPGCRLPMRMVQADKRTLRAMQSTMVTGTGPQSMGWGYSLSLIGGPSLERLGTVTPS